MRLRLLWLLLTSLFLAILLVEGIRPEPAPRWPARTSSPWAERLELYQPVLWPLLLTVAGMVVMFLFSLDYSSSKPSGGDLEHLLALKQRKALLPSSRRARGGARAAPAGEPGQMDKVAAGPPVDGLGQLVRLKRRGALAPPVPQGRRVNVSIQKARRP